MYVRDTLIGNVSVTKYKVKCRKRGEMRQILIGNCGRFIFCSQNFKRKKREIILCIQNPLCIKIMCL